MSKSSGAWQRCAVVLCLAACHGPSQSTPPPPTPIAAPSANHPAPPLITVTTDAGFVGSSPIANPDPWTEAYPDTELSANDVVQLRSQMTTAASAHLREGAAFILGRRIPDDAFGALVSVLPVDVQTAFVRGMAGRAQPHALRNIPARFGHMLSVPDDALVVATVAGRLHLPIEALEAGTVQRLLTSDTLNDQIAGARLLGAPGTPLPITELFYGLRPQSIPALVRSLAARKDFTVDQWVPLLMLVRSRVVANPRAWGNAWVAIRDGVPHREPTIADALRTAIPTVDAITALPAGVLAALHCGNAGVLDRLDHTITHSLHCASGAEHWRALATAVEVLGTKDTPTEIAVGGIRQVLHEAGNDARVLEAIPPVAVTLPPAGSHMIFETLAASRDPGVLAAVLEQLALHVQHARALPLPVRTALIAAPFGLPEAESIEARTHAIELARALHSTISPGALQTRALQSAMSPASNITPAAQSVPTAAVRGTLVLNTSNGRVVIQLREDTARQATETVVRAASGGRYNGTSFHRVVPGFVAQGGDPRQDGYGGTDTITPTELSGERFERGAVGIALAGLDTGGMQFFVVTADSPHLDGRYPYIGSVTEGIDVVDGLMVGDTIDHAEFTPHLGN